jgi:hypothetical protein
MSRSCIAIVVLVAGLGGWCATAAGSSTADGCPVSIPTRTVPPDAGMSAAAFNYGGGHLRVHLSWRRGVLRAGALPGGGSMATIEDDGSIRTKVGWWRGVPGRLVVTGRRLDRPAPPLRSSVLNGYGPKGFQPSGLFFPTVGCWRVVGKVGRASLTFVVKVTRIAP